MYIDRNSSHKSFLERFDKVVMAVILVSSVVFFLYAYYPQSKFLQFADTFCALFFVAEMAIKMKLMGLKGYWRNGWNRLDGTLIILSLPSLFACFFPVTDLSFLLIFRLLRVFRFFRVIHFFPDAEQIGKNFINGLKKSFSLFVGYFIIVCIFALLSTSLFGHKSPEYFGTPVESIYSIFRLFTIEGWYDIPDAVTAGYGTLGVLLTRLYFVFLLIIGGVVGLSLINSVFVDAMVSDNNDDIQKRLVSMEKKIDLLLKENEKLRNNQEQISDYTENDACP